MRFSFLVLAAALNAQSVYEIRPAPGAHMTLDVHKTGLMSGKKHIMVFERYSGTLDYDAKAPEKSRVELAIEAASLVVKDDWINDKRKKDVYEEAVGPNMLETAKFPQLRFVSTTVTRNAAGGFDIAGTLTIRNVAKPVTFTVTAAEESGRLRIRGKAVVKLRDFDRKPPTATFGVIGTRNEMDFLFDIFATPRS